MYKLNVPKQVVCCTFLNNKDFLVGEEVEQKIILSMIEGAVKLSNERSKFKNPLIIWYGQYNDDFLCSKMDYMTLDATDSVVKAWSICISNFHDGDENYLFSSLMKNFSLTMYNTLKFQDIVSFVDMKLSLICVVENEKVIVTNDIEILKENIISENVAFDDVNILYTESTIPVFPEADESIKKMLEHPLIYDLFYTNIVWEDNIYSLVDCVNALKGSPTYEQLVSVLFDNGIAVEKEEIKELGITEVDIYDRIICPTISINKSLNDNFAKIVLMHEIGHLIMHLPILIAEKLQNHYCLTARGDIKRNIQKNNLLIEREADWVGAALLCPSSITSYLLTRGLPREGFQIIIAARNGKGFKETFEYRVFSNLKKSVLGSGLETWEDTYDDIDEFNSLLKDENNYIISENSKNTSINKMIIRFTNMVVHRDDISIFFNNRPKKIQELLYLAFGIIIDYLGQYESD